jgi:hypothetical protein
MSVSTIFYKYKDLYEEVQELEASMDPDNESYVWREYEDKRELEEYIARIDKENLHNVDLILKVPSETSSTTLTKSEWVGWTVNNKITRLDSQAMVEFFKEYPDGLIQIG